jgi:hypothetical protein
MPTDPLVFVPLPSQLWVKTDENELGVLVALAMSPDDIGDRCDYFVVMTKSGHIERCTRVRSMLIEGKEFIDDDDDY